MIYNSRIKPRKRQMNPFSASNVNQKQYSQIEEWHKNEPELANIVEESIFLTYVTSNNMCNYKLWHEEDFARRTDVKDSEIADVKRKIDKWNQQRNDFIEKIDESFIKDYQSLYPSDANSRQHSETIGSILDKLSILSLKIYHMLELIEVYPQREDFTRKLTTLQQQRKDLVVCLAELLEDIYQGKRYIKIYRQMKMYNNPETNAQLNKDLK